MTEPEQPVNPEHVRGSEPAERLERFEHERYEAAMGRAVEIAKHGMRGANPLVGAVLLDPEGDVISVGNHFGAGSPHAEIRAISGVLQSDPVRSRGATLVVTLEPCAHRGRTPACYEAILEAGISTVVYAVDDPDPIAGGGAQRLRKAGVRVISGVGAAAATELNRRWLRAVHQRRPYTSLHIAQTIDGKIAGVDGSSQWISGPEALAANHALRARADAILVGTGTVLADNPRLTARTSSGQLHYQQPLRVVFGRREIPQDAAVRGDGYWFQIRGDDPLAAGQELYAWGIRHLMVEGGSQVTAAFIAADLVDELIVSIAPKILGAGIPAIGDLGIGTLADALRFVWDPSGYPLRYRDDVILTLIPAPGSGRTGGTPEDGRENTAPTAEERGSGSTAHPPEAPTDSVSSRTTPQARAGSGPEQEVEPEEQAATEAEQSPETEE